MQKIITIVVGIALIGSSFYGGMKYQQSKNFSGNFSRQNFQGNVGAALKNVNGRTNGSGFLSGEIINKDNQSLTIKMIDGSSKIVFFSDSVVISKTTEGTLGDLEVGKQITIIGNQNSDGSYTAKTIQLSSRGQPAITK